MVLQKENEIFSNAIARWAFEYDISLAKKWDEKTVANYLHVVNKFQEFISYEDYDNIKFSDVDHKLLNKYIDYRDSEQNKKTGKKLEVSTKRNDKKILILFFEYIEDENDDEFEFSIKWKKLEVGKLKRKEKEIFDEDDVISFLRDLEKNMKKKRDEFSYMLSLTFKLALFGGLRVSEICKLKLDSFGKPYVSKKNDKKFIPVTIEGKGDTRFTNPIPYEYVKNEYNFFKRNNNKGSFLFKTITGKTLTRFNLYRYFEDISAKLNLGKKGVHIIRRTFASNLNELGVDIRNIQLLMRHTDIKTTSIYTARSQRQMEDAVSKL